MNKKLTIKIGHLYGSIMNTYGDNGNIIILKKRCEWRGIEVKIFDLSYQDKIKKGDYDLYFFGGGQDQAQSTISRDLTGNKSNLIEEVDRGVPLLSICGGYQLLGDYYQPFEGEKLLGLGLFPSYTVASKERMIGNLFIEVMEDGLWVMERGISHYLVGFENHSGKTYLNPGCRPLGKVVKGYGNNGEDQTEGCVYKNAVGCYMHGSLLPKNPLLADWLIQKALETKYEEKFDMNDLDDGLENTAHQFALNKYS